MQYTETIQKCLKESPIGREELQEQDWEQILGSVNDPRRKQGSRFSLRSILLLALGAILSNHVSELAIAQWGAAQGEEVKKALGFRDGKTPHQTTIQRLFRRLSIEELEEAFRGIFLQMFEKEKEKRGGCAVAIDGKAQKGRLKFEEEGSYPVHAVSIVEHQTGIVLTQGHVEPNEKEADCKPNEKKKKEKSKTKKSESTEAKKKQEQEEKKQKSELAVASHLIGQIDWQGKVLTGDALYCQRALCQALVQLGGDYFFIVTGNQPHLFEDIQLLFAPVAAETRAGVGTLLLPEQLAQTTHKGHGRLEVRSIRVSSELKGYCDWPGLEQVCQIHRRWQSKGEWHEEIRYGVSSLPASLALPESLLQLKRGHWTIENRLHYVKDVTMGEDKSTVHLDQGPKIMAALRNTALSLLRRAGISTIAARMRYNSIHPQAALQLLSLSV
jgi:predicted transposase YbfD/YdcC